MLRFFLFGEVTINNLHVWLVRCRQIPGRFTVGQITGDFAVRRLFALQAGLDDVLNSLLGPPEGR